MKGVLSQMKPGKGFTMPDAQDKDRLQQLEASEANEKRMATQKRVDTVAQMISDPFYVSEFTHVYFLIGEDKFYVSQYFPDQKLAIDKFWGMDDFEKANVEARAVACKKAGIRYFYLHPQKSINDLATELGA